MYKCNLIEDLGDDESDMRNRIHEYEGLRETVMHSGRQIYVQIGQRFCRRRRRGRILIVFHRRR